ncbi:hypothetical protein ACFQ1R_09025 [Mariniflexile jejuense]|uniref:Colicin import membrane protein n=1 Tax=Mariniflexile jejuense TaxID=1173582 RepID=A0ABW3JIJ4_9FLAO
MRLVAVLLFLGFAFSVQAQEVNVNGTTYKIKGKTILLDDADVTTTLSAEEQSGIWEAFNKQKALDKEREAAEKAIKKAEKEQKKAEKRLKKAEKEIKAKEKAQSKFDDANDDYNDAIKKYEKLKRKGKLSPNDEAKWLEKIADLKEDIEKAKKKL